MAMTTVGEALNIPEKALENIKNAQDKIDSLATSVEAFIDKTGPSFIEMMEKMSKAAKDEAGKIAAEFDTTIPASVQQMLEKIRKSIGEMGDLGKGLGESIANSVKVPSLGGATAAAVDLSELAAALSKMVDMSSSSASASTTMETAMTSLSKSLAKATEAMKAFVKAQAKIGKGRGDDGLKPMADDLKLLKAAVDAIAQEMAKVTSVQIVSKDQQEEVAKLRAEIDALNKELDRYKSRKEKLSEPPKFSEVIEKIKEHQGQLQALKKDYADLFKIMGGTSVSEKTFHDAAAAAVELGQQINDIAYKTKMLPMGMEQFKKVVSQMSGDQLRQIYWTLTEANNAAEKGSAAQQMYSEKLTVVKQAIVSYVQAIQQSQVSLSDWVNSILQANVTVESLRKLFSILQRELSQTTWSKDSLGRLKPDMEGLEEAIGKCVVKMNEYNRAQQDVLAAAEQVGQAAVQSISKYGVENRNSVELERLAQDLKTAMRHLDENSQKWEEYRGNLAKVEAQQGKLDAKMGDTERSARRVKEEVVYAADSLGYYKRELQRLNSAASSNTIGSQQWAQDVKNISEYAAKVELAQRQTELLTMSEERFAQKLASINSTEGFQAIYADLDELRKLMRVSGVDATFLDERITALSKANLEWDKQQKPRTFDEINADVKASQDNIEALKKIYQELVGIMSKSDYGSDQFYKAAAAAGVVNDQIKSMEQYAKRITDPIETFKSSIKGLDKDALESIKNDFEKLQKNATALGLTAEQADMLALKLNLLDEALSNLGKGAKKSKDNAAAMTLAEIRNVVLELDAPLEKVRQQYQLLSAEMGKHLPTSDEFKALAPMVDQLAEKVRVLAQEEERYKKGLESMTEGIKKAFGGGNVDSLKSMSMAELEQTLSRIKTCMDNLSRTDMTAYRSQWNELYGIWAQGNQELQKMKAEQEALMGAKYSWQTGTMDDRTAAANGVEKQKVPLEELRALQQALYNDISKCDDLTSQSAIDAIAAYRKVGSAVKSLENAIKGVTKATKDATGTKRGFDAIELSIKDADATMKTLLADFNDLRQKTQNMQLGLNTKEWMDAYNLMNLSVNKMESFRNATIAQNEQVQHLLDKIALLNREMSASGSAAVGRYQSMGGFSGGGIAGFEASIKQADTTAEKLKQDLSDIQALLQKTPKFDAAGNVTAEWTELCRLEKLAMETLEKYNREKAKASTSKPVASYSEAMAAANSAKSYNELKDAIKKLKEAMNSLDPNKDATQWNALNAKLKETQKTFDDLRKKMGEIKEHSSKMRNAFASLRQTMLMAFSLSTIKGYLVEMTKIHAQMRLQNVALRAILQNKEEADRIFLQVQQMALRSPFSIMQMTTYTKQLAAYRVEAEKLVGTTKMLADVSAGLGVQMDRLILAYGQVKSANYLRATEVRQFTEAGLNIAGELANYFTEVRGQMVSVADVMDMISKRMVKFEDVEEIFKRITSAGGLFYDMQKKQSDTVHGQIQRIADAYSIMMDEIGQGNQSALQWVLTTIREVLANWRTFAAMAKHVAIGFALVKSAALFATVANSKFVKSLISADASMKTFTASTNIAKTALKGFGMALGGIATMGVGLALGWLVEKLYEVWTAGDAAKEALRRIADEADDEAEKAVNKYEKLANRINDVATSVEERREALEELQRTYGKYLPKQMLELENIQQMSGAYKDATQAIRQHYAEVENANRVQFYQGEAQKKMNEYLKDEDFLKYLGMSETEMSAQLTAAMEKAMEAGITEWKDARQYMVDQLEAYTGKTVDVQHGFASQAKSVWEAYKKMSDAALEYRINAKDVTHEQYEAMVEDLRTVNKQQKANEKRKQTLLELQAAYIALQKTMKENPNYDPSEDIKKIQDKYRKLELPAPDTAKITEEVLGTAYGITLEMERCGAESGDKFVERFKSAFSGLGAYVKGVLQGVEDDIEKNSPGETTKWMRQLMVDAEKSVKSDGLFQSVLPKEGEAVAAVGKQVKNLYDQRMACEKQYQESVAAGISKTVASEKFLSGVTIEQYKARTKAVGKVAQKLGQSLGTSRSGGQQEDPWKARLESLKKYQSEYARLRKSWNADAAKEIMQNSYADYHKQVWGGTGYADMQTMLDLMDELRKKYADAPEMLSEMEGFSKLAMAELTDALLAGGVDVLANEKTKKDWQEFAAKMWSEWREEMQKNALEQLKADTEDLTARFELTKTFEDLGIAAGKMEELWGQKPIRGIKQLRKEMEALAESVKASGQLGDDYEKWWADQQKKLADLELKQMQEQTKNYIKYTKEAMDERGRIMLEAYQEQNRILNDDNIDEPTKKLALQQVAKGMNEALAKQNWEDFKGSDMYIMLFENLDTATDAAISRTIEKMEQLKESWKDLPADQVRALVKELEKLKDTQMTRNPLKSVITAYNEVKALKKQGITRESLDLAEKNYQQMAEGYREQIGELEQIQALRIAGFDDTKLTAEQVALMAKYESQTNEEISDNIATVRQFAEANDLALQKVQEQKDKYNGLQKALINLGQQWGEYMQAARKAMDIVKGVLESVGVEMDSVGGIIAQGVLDLIDMAVQTAIQIALWSVLGTTIKSALGPIGWILMALEAVATLFTVIFRAGDKAKEKQIERLKDKVDELSNAYDRLKDKIDNAYRLDDYECGTKQAKENIEQQIRAYEKMIELEKSKKATDDDALKEYQQAIDDLKDELADLADEKTKALGGFGSDGRLDAAQAFIDAWYDAFEETGDGLDALGDKWDEYIANLLKKQAAYRIVGKRMESFFDLVDEMANAHSEMSMREILDKITAMEGDVLQKANDELKEWFDYFGWSGSGDLLLSDLQKGIQNITEAQAAALESITNSIRFGVWRQVEILEEIARSVSRQYASDGGGELEVLKGIQREVAETRYLLLSVTRKSSDGRSYVKVN